MARYIITKSYETMRFCPDLRRTTYTQVTAEETDNGLTACYRDISKAEAIELIEAAGLVPVKENKHGIIWDTPRMEFQEKYQSIINIPD